MSDPAYADDIVILSSSSYSEMQGLLDADTRHAAAVGMRINASKTKVMSAFIPDEQRQAVRLHGEPLKDVEKFKYLGSMFVANGQGTEEIRSRINLARSRREISLRTKGRVYQAVVGSILLYCCETWPVRVADERMLEVFDNDNIRRILRVRRRDIRVPSVELRHRVCLLVRIRLRWFGHATRRPEQSFLIPYFLSKLVTLIIRIINSGIYAFAVLITLSKLKKNETRYIAFLFQLLEPLEMVSSYIFTKCVIRTVFT